MHFDAFRYVDGSLHCGDVALSQVADRFGTPTYVYSAQGIRDAYRSFELAFAELSPNIRFAMKSLSNIHVCRLLAELGAGVDVVSGGELERAWIAGVPVDNIVFAGVGKTDGEIRSAMDGSHSPLADTWRAHELPASPVGRGRVGYLNVESEAEASVVDAEARRLGISMNACVRVNPDIDPRTHRHTSTGRREDKFGVTPESAEHMFERYRHSDQPGLSCVGLHAHLGSPMRTTEPLAEAARFLTDFRSHLRAKGLTVEAINIGGGIGVDYVQGEAPQLTSFANAVTPTLLPLVEEGVKILLEPGRAIVANNGVLLMRVTYVKHGRDRCFIICDGGMHSFIRPVLYEAFHFIWPCEVQAQQVPEVVVAEPDLPGLARCDVVGPVCETADTIARDRPMPPVERGDVLSVFSAGAYGMTMASTYNDHGRPAEVLVDGHDARLIRRRETFDDLIDPELRL